MLLGVDLFPKADVPVVSVTATLPGASTEELETTVTRPIEEAINTVSGVDELRSIVREGVTTVVVLFVLEKNGDIAAQEVRDKVSAIVDKLPQGMQPPLIDTFDLDASPIITVGVSGRRDVREVTEIAKYRIQEILQTVPGVGAVFLSGGRTRAINVSSIPITSLRTTCRSRTCGSPFCGRTSKCPAESSSRARASSCCGHWAASRRPRSSTT